MAEAQRLYQDEKEQVLTNPHPLGLEIKVKMMEQGVVFNPIESLVTVTSSPGQPKSFQLLLTNTRKGDIEEEQEEGKPNQIGIVVHQCFLMGKDGAEGLDSVFQLSDELGVTNNPPEKKIRLRSGKKYNINVTAVVSKVGVYKAPLMVVFSHDTASPKLAANERERSYMVLDLLLSSGQASKSKKKKKEGKQRAKDTVASDTAEKVAELNCKETEMEEFRQSIEKTKESYSHEMSVLITSAAQIEDLQIQREKNISDIDAEIERLKSRRKEIIQEREIANQDEKEIEERKKSLESFLDSYTVETNEKIQKLQEEIDSRQGGPTTESEGTEPDLPETSSQFLQFMERQIKDMVNELECPVCFEIASQAPIFRCEEDHLICSNCREKMVCCPVCRVEYPGGAPKRLRGAERQAERLVGLYKDREALL